MIGTRSIVSRTCLLLMVAMFCTVQNSVAEDLQRETAEQFAEKVLNLYKTKDIPKLLALSPNGPPPASVLERYAPGTPRYKSLFSDTAWRWQAVQEWKGGIKVVRYERTALVEFAKGETAGKANSVRLEFEGGKWRFEMMSEDGADDLARLQFNRIKADGTKSAMVNDLKSTAIRVLKAFQAKSVDDVLKMSVADGPLELQYLSADEKQQPKSDFLFSNEQMAGIADWDGSVGAIYISETAHAEFGRAGSEVFVVAMPRVGDEWKFDDIHSPDAADFDALSAENIPKSNTSLSHKNELSLYSNADGLFEVRMPGEPQRNVTKIGEGPDAVQHQFMVGASNGVYMVAYQDHPGIGSDDAAAIENLFATGRDGFQKGIGGERTEYKIIKQAKREGRETRFRIPANGGLATTRMFFANHRWYQILVMGTADFVQSESSQTFLDSFKVTAAKVSSKSAREELIRKLKDF